MNNVIIICISVLLKVFTSPVCQLLFQFLSMLWYPTSTVGSLIFQRWLLECWYCSLFCYTDLPLWLCWLVCSYLLVLLVDVLVVWWELWCCVVLGLWWGLAVLISGVCVCLCRLVSCLTSTHSSNNVACSASLSVWSPGQKPGGGTVQGV